MRIGPISCRTDSFATVIAAPIDTREHSFDLWFKLPAGPASNHADPFLAAALLPAMKLGQDIQVVGTVSPKLTQSLSTIQEIYHTWDPALRIVEIQAAAHAVPSFSESRGLGCLFSGGVDSSYTALEHLEEIDSLIFVHGFDVLLEYNTTRVQIAHAVRETAAELGKPLLEVETNIRDFLDLYLPWRYTHQVALAGFAHSLASRFSRFYVSGGVTHKDMLPWAEHSLFDPLWSTERLAFRHDGCGTTRFDKVARIVGSDPILRRLRVCWNPAYVRNCGRCEKCVRTMIELEILGARDALALFETPLDLRALDRLDFSVPGKRIYLRENLKGAEARGHEDIAGVLRAVLDRWEDHSTARELAQIEDLQRTLAETQAWASELQAAAQANAQELGQLNRRLPVRAARAIRQGLNRIVPAREPRGAP